MSTQFKSVQCRTGKMSMFGFFGGPDGRCVQLTFPKPDFEKDRYDFGYWYTQLTKEQALDLAAALVMFANDKLKECYHD